jgi:hypothetical protein
VGELLGSAGAAYEPAEQGTARSSKSVSCNDAEFSSSTAPADIARTGACVWLSHSPHYKDGDSHQLICESPYLLTWPLESLASLAVNGSSSMTRPLTYRPQWTIRRLVCRARERSYAIHWVATNTAGDSPRHDREVETSLEVWTQRAQDCHDLATRPLTHDTDLRETLPTHL